MVFPVPLLLHPLLQLHLQQVLLLLQILDQHHCVLLDFQNDRHELPLLQLDQQLDLEEVISVLRLPQLLLRLHFLQEALQREQKQMVSKLFLQTLMPWLLNALELTERALHHVLVDLMVMEFLKIDWQNCQQLHRYGC